MLPARPAGESSPLTIVGERVESGEEERVARCVEGAGSGVATVAVMERVVAIGVRRVVAVAVAVAATAVDIGAVAVCIAQHAEHAIVCERGMVRREHARSRVGEVGRTVALQRRGRQLLAEGTQRRAVVARVQERVSRMLRRQKRRHVEVTVCIDGRCSVRTVDRDDLSVSVDVAAASAALGAVLLGLVARHEEVLERQSCLQDHGRIGARIERHAVQTIASGGGLCGRAEEREGAEFRLADAAIAPRAHALLAVRVLFVLLIVQLYLNESVSEGEHVRQLRAEAQANRNRPSEKQTTGGGMSMAACWLDAAPNPIPLHVAHLSDGRISRQVWNEDCSSLAGIELSAAAGVAAVRLDPVRRGHGRLLELDALALLAGQRLCVRLLAVLVGAGGRRRSCGRSVGAGSGGAGCRRRGRGRGVQRQGGYLG